jgi:myo-inositol 2-dehydrogenase / D-chiro-inositol 1-dehydrogenase
VLTRPEPGDADRSDPEVLAGMVTGGVMGLAIHDLPLVRRLVARGGRDWSDVEVLSAEVLAPFGYLIELRIGGVDVELHALMSGNWAPDWSLTATADDAELEVAFTPSYVQAGSAGAEVATVAADGTASTVVFRAADSNGYEGEWREIAALAAGAAPRIPLDALIDDLRFALDIAAQSADRVRAGAGVAA